MDKSNQDILVDRTVFIQGILDARDANNISPKFADQLLEAIELISYAGGDERYICKYRDLLVILSLIDPVYRSEVIRLWKYLGKALSSGISVAI